MRILVAEDEAIIGLDLRTQLEADGFELCSEARNGLEAVEIARSEQPDLAILDVRMPRLDGIEAARRINSERRIPIVILSAHADHELVERAVDAGISAYLVKPFDPRNLAPAIETAFARHRELAALAARAKSKERPRRRATSPGRRCEIVAAAATVFAERGYEAATIQEIAELVGMLKGSLYYHIASKEDLLFEVVRDVTERQAALLPPDTAGNPVGRLRDFLRSYAAFAVENVEALEVSVRDVRRLGTDRRRVVERIRTAHVDALESLIADGQRLGLVTAEVTPPIAAQVVLGLADALPARQRASGGPEAVGFAEAYVAVVAAGLLAGTALDTAA